MGRIVVGVDGSAPADRALAWAAKRARATGTPLEVLHGYVVHPRGGVLLHDEREAAERILDQVVERNRMLLDGLEWSATVMPALWAASSALIDAADRGADIVVVGSRGLGGFKELLVGATSYRTAAHATVPVAVIRGAPGTEDRDDRRPVVVGVDGSRVGGRALRWALAEARRREVPLTAVHAYDVPANVALLGMITDEALRRLRDRARDEAAELLEAALRDAGARDDDVEPVVEEGTPAAALLQHAGADHLLVVGTHGRGGVRRALLGSVSHQCLHHATGPVVVVP